jgi:hypothetical protein
MRGWVSRPSRTVEVNIGRDALKVIGATSEQQEQIIDAWLVRHVSGG